MDLPSKKNKSVYNVDADAIPDDVQWLKIGDEWWDCEGDPVEEPVEGIVNDLGTGALYEKGANRDD